MGITSFDTSHKKFQDTVWNFYRKNSRIFPWRIPEKHKIQKKNFITYNPYRILLSEIMLQQTQTDRVVPKYENWLKHFPSFKDLAKAKLQDILKEWQGLGYNRRALALKKLSEIVATKYEGKFPDSYEELVELPGIGPYTAGAVLAFAFNKPHPIIETNIRTVFIHHFFNDDHGMIHDQEIMKLIEETLDRKNPREWYWALMDYGSHLKKTLGNLNKRSRHYTKQSKFIGSNRQVRSAILRVITAKTSTKVEIEESIKAQNIEVNLDQITKNIIDLENEGFIKKRGKKYVIV